MKRNILITGASGLIGTELFKQLTDKGYRPLRLSTSYIDDRPFTYKWDPNNSTVDLIPYDEIYGLINLAGVSIADTKWNTKGMALIRSSRIQSTHFLKSILASNSYSPKHIISASAIGYYGLENDVQKTESSMSGNDFAAKVCHDWEQEAAELKTKESQLSILRIGIVLAKKGGFYKKIKSLAKWKMAASLGSGKQPICWIHIDDLVAVIIDILENKLNPGIYNAVANINTNSEVTKLIAYKNGQPFLMPKIPLFLLKLFLGEKAEMITRGAEVSNSKLIKEGFTFKFDNIKNAISDLVKS